MSGVTESIDPVNPLNVDELLDLLMTILTSPATTHVEEVVLTTQSEHLEPVHHDECDVDTVREPEPEPTCAVKFDAK